MRLENFALPYIDDIAIFSENWELHLKQSDIVLSRLSDAGLTVKPTKYKFAQSHVRFLSHEVGSRKRSPSDIIIKAL